MRWVLIPSPCVKTTPEPFTIKVRRSHVLLFLTFSSNKRWWRLRAPSFLGRRTRVPPVALLPKGRLRELATPLGTVLRELGHFDLCAFLTMTFLFSVLFLSFLFYLFFFLLSLLLLLLYLNSFFFMFSFFFISFSSSVLSSFLFLLFFLLFFSFHYFLCPFSL